LADQDFIQGLGTRSSVIHAVPDAAKRGLSPEELSLATCAGMGTSVADVLKRAGMPEAKAIALLLGLRLKGIIGQGPFRPASAASEVMRGGAAASRPMGQASRPPVAAPVRPAAPAPTPAKSAPTPTRLDAVALAEAIDLDVERKREILELEAKCTGDHFAVLGLAVGAEAAEVKKAYYELSRRFHPDRFYGKNLGSYKARVDLIFKRLTEAQSVLSDPAKRKAYLEQHPELAPAPAAPLSQEAQERANERRSRLARHPYLAQRGRVAELIGRGRALLDKKEFGRAASELELAVQADPKNAEANRLLQEAKRGADRIRAETAFKEATGAESMGDHQNALARMRTAVMLDGENAQYRHRLARLLSQAGSEAALKEAHGHARRATEIAPKEVEYHLTFAGILTRAGLDMNAIREYETVLKLRPDDAFAKDQLRKLKWKI